MTTQHTHPMVFGRRVQGCPRCVELDGGAATVQWKLACAAQMEAARRREIHAHFTSHKHLSGGCGPVCTFGDY